MRPSPQSPRWGRVATLAISAVALAFGVWAGATQHSSSQSRVEQTYSKDNGYFYRMTAKFTVKETGEAVDFDYVVACNIRLTRWRDGGLSNDSSFGPRMMVKATAGRQAVMLKTLRACHGLTSENGDVPPDVLPLAIWFDSVDDLSNGLGYVSEDGYDNPLGKLKFRGARIDPATGADWEAWRKKSADEYIQRGALPGPWGYDYPDDLNKDNSDIGKYVSECQGYSRRKLPDDMRAKLRELWPPERPGFWALPNADNNKISQLMSDPKQPSPPGGGPWNLRWGSISDIGTNGLPIRSGRRVQHFHVPSRWPTEAYPLLWPPMVSAVPLTTVSLSPSTEVYVQKLDFRDGALNGFAACQNRKDRSALFFGDVDPQWNAKRHVFMIDDYVVRERVEGTIYMLAPAFVLERDEYVFTRFSNGL
jgi:hypothetical protein